MQQRNGRILTIEALYCAKQHVDSSILKVITVDSVELKLMSVIDSDVHVSGTHIKCKMPQVTQCNTAKDKLAIKMLSETSVKLGH